MIWNNKRTTHLREEIIWKMAICNCGNCVVYEIIKQILERAEHRWSVIESDPLAKTPEGFDNEIDATPAKWVEFAAQVCDSWDLLDHGGTIVGAWLTENGKLLLEFLREFGCQDDDWPDWAQSEVL